ncbi:hypothetical protein FCV25MIE_18424 [Fagus crenata]
MANLDHEVPLPEAYLSDDGMVVLTSTPASSTTNSPLLGTSNNDMSLLGKGVLPRMKIDVAGSSNYYRFEGKVGKLVRPRLLKKVNQVAPQVNLHQTKVRSIQRSLSIGSPRTPPFKKGEDVQLKLERFKVRTLIMNGSVELRGQGTKDGQGGNTKSSTST